MARCTDVQCSIILTQNHEEENTRRKKHKLTIRQAHCPPLSLFGMLGYRVFDDVMLGYRVFDDVVLKHNLSDNPV